MARDKYLVGNITTSKFSTMWQESQILRELRSLNVNTLNQKCSQCDFRYFCGGYCRGETIASGKSVMFPYIRCSEWKRGITKILSILSESPDIYCLGEDPYKGVVHRE